MERKIRRTTVFASTMAGILLMGYSPSCPNQCDNRPPEKNSIGQTAPDIEKKCRELGKRANALALEINKTEISIATTTIGANHPQSEADGKYMAQKADDVCAQAETSIALAQHVQEEIGRVCNGGWALPEGRESLTSLRFQANQAKSAVRRHCR